MPAPPIAPARQLRLQQGELQALLGRRPGDSAHLHLAPKTLGLSLRLAVVQQYVGVPEQSAHPELADLSAGTTVKDKRRMAERAIAYGNWNTAESIVDVFMPDQDT